MTKFNLGTALSILALASLVGCKALGGAILKRYRQTDPETAMVVKQGDLDPQGLQTGEWTYYFKSGMVRAQGRYEQDRQVGEWTYFHDQTGMVERKGAFDERGRRTGEWLFQYPDGSTRSRGRYVADAEEGPWEFRAADGTLERAGQFENRLISGYWVHQSGGRPSAEGLCHRGQRVGQWLLWDASGMQTAHDFGLPPGMTVVLERWPNGKLRRAGIQMQGKPVGRWGSWHENGTPQLLVGMAEGSAAGLFEARASDGTVLGQGLWSDGQGPSSPALAELLAPARPPSVQPTVAAADPARVDVLEQGADREAPLSQPDISVLDQERLDSLVKRYLTGETQGRSPARRRAYGPGETQDSGAGPGRRADLEGKLLTLRSLRQVGGGEVKLEQYRGKKNLLLVVLRGFSGEVCIYCVAQTKALAMCRADLDKHDVEVLVVYPGPKENEEAFQQIYAKTFGEGAPPYRVFYDPDLTVVRTLGIEGDLAAPTSLVVDREGIVKRAYVSPNRAQRPATKELVKEFSELVRALR